MPISGLRGQVQSHCMVSVPDGDVPRTMKPLTTHISARHHREHLVRVLKHAPALSNVKQPSSNVGVLMHDIL